TSDFKIRTRCDRKDLAVLFHAKKRWREESLVESNEWVLETRSASVGVGAADFEMRDRRFAFLAHHEHHAAFGNVFGKCRVAFLEGDLGSLDDLSIEEATSTRFGTARKFEQRPRARCGTIVDARFGADKAKCL